MKLSKKKIERALVEAVMEWYRARSVRYYRANNDQLQKVYEAAKMLDAIEILLANRPSKESPG